MKQFFSNAYMYAIALFLTIAASPVGVFAKSIESAITEGLKTNGNTCTASFWMTAGCAPTAPGKLVNWLLNTGLYTVTLAGVGVMVFGFLSKDEGKKKSLIIWGAVMIVGGMALPYLLGSAVSLGVSTGGDINTIVQ